MTNIETLLGKTMESVTQNGTESIIFVTTAGETYQLMHNQDCCESVYIEDVNGNLDDLVGVPILMSEEADCDLGPEGNYVDDSFTWTFYKFGTIKGYVDVRFYGTSSGYYSETAHLYGPK